MKRIALLIIMAIFGTVFMPLVSFADYQHVADTTDDAAVSVTVAENHTEFQSASACAASGLHEGDLLGTATAASATSSASGADGLFTITCAVAINSDGGARLSLKADSSDIHFRNGTDNELTPVDYRFDAMGTISIPNDGDNNTKTEILAGLSLANGATDMAVTDAYQNVGDVAIAYTSDIHDAVEADDSYANITMVFEFDQNDEYSDFDDIWTGTYSETINLKFVAL